MHKILLKGRGIEHAYSEGAIRTPVLKGVDLDIEASKMTAIVGKSGSGKSTLLHILGTLDSPDKGEIVFYDTNILTLSARDKAVFRNRHLGFVYQFHHLLGDFSAQENIMMPLLIDGVSRQLAAGRADYLLERVGLAGKGSKLPAEMSGGERQRVAIARALAYSPELILADEPTGNLDEANAALVFELFRELVRDESAAVVMVTHDSSLAARCDNVFEMTNGVIERGTFRPEESTMLDGQKLDLHTSYKDLVMQRLRNISASSKEALDSMVRHGAADAATAATLKEEAGHVDPYAPPPKERKAAAAAAAAYSTTVGSYRIPKEESNATGSRLRDQAEAAAAAAAASEATPAAAESGAAAQSAAAGDGCTAPGDESTAAGTAADAPGAGSVKGADGAGAGGVNGADSAAGKKADDQECKAVIFERTID